MSTVLQFARGTRKCESWIASFAEYTKGAQSNDLFRQWSAIGVLAGALERKVWVISQGAPIYPNLYIFLVGPPGIGKTRQLGLAGSLYNSIVGTDDKSHWVARVSLTKASLMDQLGAASRNLGDGTETFNSLLILSYELGALIPQYDPDFLNALTYIYDCIKYDEVRRGTKDQPLIIERPQITMLACCTPGYLVTTMPPSAWDQGFLARVIIIYNSETETLPLNLNDEHPYDNEELHKALISDLKEISTRRGKLKFTKSAGEFLHKWNNGTHIGSRLDTAPTHPRLGYYNTRRPVQLLKLCMVAAVDAGADDIDQPQVELALDWLLGAEKYMGGVFMVMGSGGDAAVINDCWHYAIQLAAKSRDRDNWVVGIEINRFLQTRIPPYQVKAVIEQMVRAGMLEYYFKQNVPGFKVKAVLSL